jgi:hypothetical protein
MWVDLDGILICQTLVPSLNRAQLQSGRQIVHLAIETVLSATCLTLYEQILSGDSCAKIAILLLGSNR